MTDTALKPTTEMVRVWDLPTRIFHWLLVACIFFAWASFEFSDTLNDPALRFHRYNGYAIVILILWRLMWGFVGPHPVRFTSFVRGPGRMISYTSDLLRGRDTPYLGHNPLGALGVLALLAMVGFQGTLGLFTEEHNFTTWGPLSRLTKGPVQDWINETHQSFFDILLIVIAVHIAAGLYHTLFKREPLIPAMITGRKPAGSYAEGEITSLEDQPSRLAVSLRALVLLAISTAILFGTIKLLGGRVFY